MLTEISPNPVAVNQVPVYCDMPIHRELAGQWSSLCNGLLTEALFLSNVSSTLESQALQPLNIHLLNDLDKRFKAVSSVPILPYMHS